MKEKTLVEKENGGGKSKTDNLIEELNKIHKKMNLPPLKVGKGEGGMVLIKREKQKVNVDDELYEKYLSIVAKCYIKKDFEDLYPLLAKDVVWESTWLKDPREGYETVCDYYENKGKQLRNSSWTTRHYLSKTLDPFTNPKKGNVRANGNTVILAHKIGKYIDYVVQEDDKGNLSDMVIDLEINDYGLISRIDICIADMFHFERIKEITI